MKRALIAAAVLARGELAEAGSRCGGGGSTSSSSDSSSAASSSSAEPSTGSSSWSTPAPPEPACRDTTDIVGYRQCTRFGGWRDRHGAPLSIEGGLALRTFTTPLGTRTGSVTHETETFTFRTIGPAPEADAPLDTALVSTLRLGAGLTHGIYVALEGELGGVTDGHAGAPEMITVGERGAATIRQQHAVVMSGLAVAGVGGNLGTLNLGAELAGGVRDVSYRYESSYGACVQTETLSVVSTVVEARARALLWTSPFVSLGATVGASLVDRGAWVAGLQLGFSSTAFAGTRR